MYLLLKISLKFSLRDSPFRMAPLQQLEVSWSVVCATCCHMALVFAVMHLYIFFIAPVHLKKKKV